MDSKMHLKIKILHMLLLSYLAIAGGVFIDIPISQTVSVGEVAEFRCSHSTADTIRWRVNGTLLSNNKLPPDITLSTDSDSVNILTIIGLPIYNRTEVVGVARFDDGSPEETTNPVAMLEVSMNTTEENMAAFIEVPQSVTVNSGGQAQFRCEHPSAEGYIWLVNGTALRNLPQNIQMNFIVDDEVLLLGQALPEYNLTSVQCVATFTNRLPLQSFTATLTIQGHLDDVKDLKKQNSTLSWMAPFSLDLTNVEPDIVYCVDVYNITCGGRELLISDCDVTETSYTSDVIAPDGYIYEYIVTPRSNVEGAINGTPSQPLREYLPTFTGLSTRLSIENSGQDLNVRAYQIKLTYSPNQPIPSSYSLSLQSLDGLVNMDRVETTATIEPSVLTLEVVSGLSFRRLWNCTVVAYGCQGNNIVNDELSTHDFRNISSSSHQPGEVRVTGSFTDDSTATGVLVIVIGDSEVIYHKASRDGTDKIKETLITGLAGGEYSISVFVVEKNGLPFERVAASPKLVTVETNDVVTPPSSSIEYSLQSTSTGVCITCTFLDSSATDCVAVVHQRISQLSSSGLMNIESNLTRNFLRSGDTASGCIEVVNREDYQVGVVGGRQVTIVSEKSNLSLYIVIIVTVVLVLLTLVVLVMIVFVCKRSQKKRMGHLRVHIRSGSPTTTNNHDTESGHGNEYEKSPLDKKEEITVSTPPPLYSEIASQEAESAVGHHQTSAPVVPHGNQPVYAEALSIQVNAVATPAVVERTEYDKVNGFKNPEGLNYAIVHPKTKPQKTPLDDIRDRVVYSKLMHQASKDVMVDDSNEKDNHPQLAIDTPTPTPFTSSNLLSLLHPVVSKWKELAEALSVDEDDIDDIFTNNETNDACLQELLDRFIVVHHNWADVEGALRKMGEEHLAERASQLYVLPKSVQPEMTDHLGTEVLVYDDKCQPKVESSVKPFTYYTEENVKRNTSDSNRTNDTLKSVNGLTLKSTDSGYDSRHSSEEAICDSDRRVSPLAHDQPPCNVTDSPPDKCQRFFTQLGTEEPQQQNTQCVQSEHDDDCYVSGAMSSLKVSHHLQMPKEEQQRLIRCKPVRRDGLWQKKASLLSQDDKRRSLHEWLTDLRVSVVNRVHHLQEWLSGVRISPASTYKNLQGWLSNLQESVVSFASLQLSRLKMLICVTSLMSQAVED